MLKVQLRSGFSDRMGIKNENTEIQLTELDDRTRMALINAMDLLWGAITDRLMNGQKNPILIKILSQVYMQQASYGITYDDKKVLEIVYNTIKNDDYDDVLTIVEYLAQQLNSIPHADEVNPFTYLNYIFEKEYVGYRFVNEIITPISNEVEIKEIEEASNSPYKQVNVHLDKSLEMLSDRENPDYENAIKESISAVECMCSIIIGKATTLGNALDKLENAGLIIHPSMKSAFDKLYGYTSDGAGIRHSGKLGGSQSTFEEAKFMLVSCCAFVNYLIGVMSKYK